MGRNVCSIHSNPMPQVTPLGVSHTNSSLADFSKTILLDYKNGAITNHASSQIGHHTSLEAIPQRATKMH